ncbi:MAG: ComEC/Rec2-related protein [Pedosphaera sp.]|nr:ComEC/Rec2-related protein [Pedosphaera sp.]
MSIRWATNYIYHIFAVDGLRIAIISGILIGLLRVLGIPRAGCGLMVVPLILFYTAMTGWPASAVRAIVMVIVVFGGWVLKRPRDLINSLAAAAILILVAEPRQLFQAGFQLSFFVVLCIVLIHPFFDALGKRLLRTDPLLPDELRPRWQRMLQAPARWLIELLLTSMAAWLGSIPLVAYYFHLITPASGPANVFAVPLCAFVLIANLSSLLLGAWFPWASELFNHAGWFMMKSIQVTSAWSADWPGAYFYLPMPSRFTLGLYYLILLTVLTGWLFRGEWRKWKIAGVALLSVVWCVQWVHQRPVTQVTILPLNGGHGVHVRSPGWGNEWLIDCGDDASVEAVVKPFLRAQGVNRLPHFILTHGSASYTGGAEATFKLFRPENIYASPVQFRSPSYKAFQQTGHLRPEWKEPLQRGKCLGPWTVLQPAADDHFAKGEDNALVLRREIDGTAILLLADPGKPGQRALLDRTNNLRADVVVAGLPSEGEPLSDTLLDAIQPQVIIIADAEYPATKQAKGGLKTRLARRNVPVLYESSSGGVTLEVRPGRWDLRAMDGTRISRKSGDQ